MKNDWLLAGGRIAGLVALYFPFSIGLTFYQKWFIKEFRFPVTVVCIHYVIKFLAVASFRTLYTYFTKRERISLGWSDMLKALGPTGMSASLDIALSNWAFEYITVSLYTMAKSSCIIFILLFAVILKLEKLTWELPVVVGLLSSGLFLFTYHSTQFNLTGFLLVELAAVCSGIRWSVSQFVMQRKEMGLTNPIDMIYHVQPWMILTCLPLAFTFEGEPLSVSLKAFDYDNYHIPLRFAGLIFIGGVIALCMELAEYLLLVNTSSLTVSVTGILKELLTLLLAHFINGDEFSAVNSVGLAFCVAGIAAHVVHKARALNSSAANSNNNRKDSDYNIRLGDYSLVPTGDSRQPLLTTHLSASAFSDGDEDEGLDDL